MKNQWRVIVGLVLLLIVVLFAVLNNQTVPVSFGFARISGPLILIILGSAIIGALIGLLTSTTTIWKQKKQIKELEHTVNKYQNDVENLAKEEVAQVKEYYEQELSEVKKEAEVFQEESVGSRFDPSNKKK